MSFFVFSNVLNWEGIWSRIRSKDGLGIMNVLANHCGFFFFRYPINQACKTMECLLRFPLISICPYC